MTVWTSGLLELILVHIKRGVADSEFCKLARVGWASTGPMGLQRPPCIKFVSDIEVLGINLYEVKATLCFFFVWNYPLSACRSPCTLFLYGEVIRQVVKDFFLGASILYKAFVAYDYIYDIPFFFSYPIYICSCGHFWICMSNSDIVWPLWDKILCPHAILWKVPELLISEQGFDWFNV